MRKCFLLCILILFGTVSCTESMDEERKEEIVKNAVVEFEKEIISFEINKIIDGKKFNGSISILQDGDLLYDRRSGFENFREKRNFTDKSIFAIASVSKQFTAVIILKLQEENKLRLEDKASKYLEDFEGEGFDEITVHQLLTHTSGLNDFGDKLLFKSGTDYQYSNKGYWYLGKIVEKVSGKKYDEFIIELFKEVGMNNSYTPTNVGIVNFASAYIGTEKNFQEVENMPFRLSEKEISTPAGGLLSSVSDLHLWNESLYNGKILKKESLDLFKKEYVKRKHEVLGEVGYGYGIMMNKEEIESYFHTGYVKGAPSLLIYYPNTRTSVVILSNIANELMGKEAIFSTHKEVKNIMDKIEFSMMEFRKNRIKEEIK